MPSKYESGGRKRHQNGKMTAKSAVTQIRTKKSWWQKVPSFKSELKKFGGKKCRQNAKVGAESATKIAKCRQKVPPLKSEGKSHGGGKCHQNGKVVAENATKIAK